MAVEISLPAALPEEDKAEVNNVIPASLLPPCNHQSRPLISVACSHKRGAVFVLNQKASLCHSSSLTCISRPVHGEPSRCVLQRRPSLDHISGDRWGGRWGLLTFKRARVCSTESPASLLWRGGCASKRFGIDGEFTFMCVRVGARQPCSCLATGP